MGRGMKRLSIEEAILLSKVNFRGYSPSEDERKIYEMAQARNDENLKYYRELKALDVYLACSLRTEHDYELAFRVYDGLTQEALTVFFAALASSQNSLLQSDLERRLLDLTKSVFLLAQGNDSWGKVSEAVEGLVRAIPVVALTDESTSRMSNYDILKNVHPRRIVRGRGMHVNNKFEGALDCLRKELAHNAKSFRREELGGLNFYCSGCGSLILRIPR